MNNKNLMIGLGVLAVAGVGLYMWKRRKDGEKKVSFRGVPSKEEILKMQKGTSQFPTTLGADGETENDSETVQDCGCKYKDTDDSTEFTIKRPKYSNAKGIGNTQITANQYFATQGMALPPELVAPEGYEYYGTPMNQANCGRVCKYWAGICWCLKIGKPKVGKIDWSKIY